MPSENACFKCLAFKTVFYDTNARKVVSYEYFIAVVIWRLIYAKNPDMQTIVN